MKNHAFRLGFRAIYAAQVQKDDRVLADLDQHTKALGINLPATEDMKAEFFSDLRSQMDGLTDTALSACFEAGISAGLCIYDPLLYTLAGASNRREECRRAVEDVNRNLWITGSGQSAASAFRKAVDKALDCSPVGGDNPTADPVFVDLFSACENAAYAIADELGQAAGGGSHVVDLPGADTMKRIARLEEVVIGLKKQMELAAQAMAHDPHTTLNKCRTTCEKLVLEVYRAEMGSPPKRAELGAVLTNNQFTRRIDRRILSLLNSIRDMGNLGSHGEDVRSSDAQRTMEQLLDVVEWYIGRYDSRSESGCRGLPQ